MQRDLTNGSIWKNIAAFSLPYLLAYFLQTLYGMADLFIIGRFNGVDSTTAVSVGSQVMHMLTVMIVGLAMGATVLIGRAVGAKDERLMNRAIGNTAVLFLSLSLVLTAVLLLSVRGVVRLMATPDEAVGGAVSYLTICFIGIPFITAYNIISSVFRGMGDSKNPMRFVAVACVCNIALDYLFIGGLGLGAAGAALGTVLAQTISVLVSLAVILRRRMLPTVGRRDFRPDRAVMGSLLRVGVPVAIQDGCIQISFVVIMIFANQRGLNDAAAVGIVEKLIGILFLVPSSMLSAVSTISAQNIGAGRYDRARQTLWAATAIAVGFGTVAAVLFQFIAGAAVACFTKDAAVVTMGEQYMRAYVWDCIFAGVHFSFSGYFCACGKSHLSFIHNLASILLARVPIAYFAAKYCTDSLYPMGLGAPIGSLLSVVICAAALLWIDRKSRSVSTIK